MKWKTNDLDFNFNLEWHKTFSNSVGRYVQIINHELSKSIQPEPLSKHIEILGGYAFKSSNYTSSGVPIIRISDFNNEKIVLNNVKYYRESEELKKFELEAGDIIIALTGGTIAKLGIVQKGIGKLYLNQRVGKFKILNPSEFEAEYVYWIARSVQKIIKDLAWGAAIPNVSPKHIGKLKFPIPNKEIQSGIISFLNDLESNIILTDKVYFNSVIEKKIILLHENQLKNNLIASELTHQLSLVKQLRQAFLREAMQGKLVAQDPQDEPAAQLLAKIKAEKERLIGEKKIKKEKELPPIGVEEVPFEVPEGWVWCRLGELALHSEGGKSLKGLDRPCEQGKWGVIKTSAITSGKFLETENKSFPNSKSEYLEIRIKKGDILFCRASGSKGLAGKSCVVINEPYANLILSDKSIRYVLSSFISPIFIDTFNSSSYALEYYLTLGTTKSTTMNNITRPQFDNLLIPLPPLAEQHRIVAKLDELMRYCDALEASIQASREQNEGLLQQVLREALEPGNGE